ncbi:MerR family transcriptional regulator [Microbacterium sp. CJ88]|uniref:MerR family transcriptional regulator n=1 Tax=Microbacterium sp. CJ88 TaxID=3445672 RepID=UPI003F658307
MKSSALSIGDAATRFGLATSVLRHWEDVGLLRPDRDAAGRRLFSDDDLVRIAVILRSKAAGMGLDRIAVLLDEQAPSRHRVLEEHLDELARRMAEMERSREMTLHALNCRAHDITTCPRFRAIMGAVVDGTGTWPGPLSTEPGGQRRAGASAR